MADLTCLNEASVLALLLGPHCRHIRPFLRCGEPVQKAANLLGDLDRGVQGQEAARETAAHFRHRLFRLPFNAARFVMSITVKNSNSSV